MEATWYHLSLQAVVLRGVLGIVFGIIAIVAPVETAIAFVLLWGVWALVDGVGSFLQAAQRDAQGRGWLLLSGVIAVIAAFFAIFSPGLAAKTLTWFLGVWLVARGVIELVSAFTTQRTTPRWLLVLGGLLSAVLGVLFMANPGRAAVGLAVWLGIVALAWGIALVVLGLFLRKEAPRTADRTSTATPPPATPPPATA